LNNGYVTHLNIQVPVQQHSSMCNIPGAKWVHSLHSGASN